MKGINQQGQAVYYNVVVKHGKVRYLVQAARSIKRRHGWSATGT